MFSGFSKQAVPLQIHASNHLLLARFVWPEGCVTSHLALEHFGAPVMFYIIYITTGFSNTESITGTLLLPRGILFCYNYTDIVTGLPTALPIAVFKELPLGRNLTANS